MILLTVGTQLPFDRLVEMIDDLAAQIDEPVVAQIGRGAYIPSNMTWHRIIDPVEFEALLASVRLVVSHAGIGTVLTAERHARPLILFPRLASMGEHRNDHQLATTVALANRRGIAVATTKEALRRCMESPPVPAGASGGDRQHRLCQVIGDFIESRRK